MDFTISSAEKKALLADAREAIAAKLENRTPRYCRSGEPQRAAEGASALTRPCGAFVTLHLNKNLRGCIGRMTASLPLEQTVRAMAVEAAFFDPRFQPLRKDELP